MLEDCRNWGALYDLLHEIPSIEEVQLADSYKVRVIAEARVEADKIDARALASLLRDDLIPRLHVPSPQNRKRKDVLRQQVFWIRQRTMIHTHGFQVWRCHLSYENRHNGAQRNVVTLSFRTDTGSNYEPEEFLQCRQVLGDGMATTPDTGG